MNLLRLLLAVWLALAGGAAAAQGVEGFDDPELNARYRALISEIRCPKCLNESIAESNAPVAADLRREVRRLMAEGASDAEIKEFLSSRYGEFVLYRPPLKATTTLLWVGPFVLLTVGAAALVMTLRRRARKVVDVPVTDEEHRRVEQLLTEGGKRS